MSIFTKRHYEYLANALRDIRAEFAGTDRLVADDFIRDFATTLADESSAFDRSLFLYNVGIIQTEVERK